eukprot:14426264-Alexandrium_andersonii.AAC.1
MLQRVPNHSGLAAAEHRRGREHQGRALHHPPADAAPRAARPRPGVQACGCRARAFGRRVQPGWLAAR